MHQVRAPVLSNQEVIFQHYKMGLYAPQIAQEANPGQFVHIRVREGYDPLLRRPFSLYEVKEEEIHILYQVVGKGTKILSQKRVGEKLDILGPLGKGFKIDENSARAWLVAGGIGVAPLYMLAREIRLRISSRKAEEFKLMVLLGARTGGEILCQEDFVNLGAQVQIATEDGSRGFKGLVSSLFKSQILNPTSPPDVVYACGPVPMLKRIAQLTLKYKVPCQVSLEQRMGCGIGACLGCVIGLKKSGLSSLVYQRVCHEGPVFNAEEVSWNHLNN